MNSFSNYPVITIIIVLLLLSCYCITAQEKYQLIQEKEYSSCVDYKIIDIEKNGIELPVNVQNALKCPSVIDLTDAILTFTDGNLVKQYNIEEKKENTLFFNFPDIDGMSNPVWSADTSKIMFVVINQKQNHNYKSFGRIIIITFDDNGNITEKRKYDKPVNFSCGNICTSEPKVDFQFVDNSGIKYKRSENIEDRPGEYEIIKIE